MDITSSTRVKYAVSLSQEEVNKFIEESAQLDAFAFSTIKALALSLRDERNDRH